MLTAADHSKLHWRVVLLPVNLYR